MNSPVVVAIAVAIAVIVAFVAWSLSKRRRSARLRERFGPEYERAVRDSGSPARAEEALESRERRVAQYHIRPLGQEESGRFAETRRRVQTGFVDEPRRAVEEADALVADLMKRLAEGFAKERSSLERQWDRGDRISTEDLRVALRRYRSFFQRLLSICEMGRNHLPIPTRLPAPPAKPALPAPPAPA